MAPQLTRSISLHARLLRASVFALSVVSLSWLSATAASPGAPDVAGHYVLNHYATAGDDLHVTVEVRLVNEGSTPLTGRLLFERSVPDDTSPDTPLAEFRVEALSPGAAKQFKAHTIARVPEWQGWLGGSAVQFSFETHTAAGAPARTHVTLLRTGSLDAGGF